MIKIDRNKVDPPEILTKENGRGDKETQKAIAYFSIPENVAKSYKKFKVYSDPEVKDALIALCDEKCAYCESKFLHVYSGDVEHFRPKGRISDADNPKPGYYWLAADWDNLLLSCRNCNQKLRHLTGDNEVKQSMGKVDQFPLLDGGEHVQDHMVGIKDEEEFRLLINPCLENPEDYFEYNIKNGYIIPKAEDDKKKKMAEESIRVYVLQRIPLIQARYRKTIEILAQIQRVKEAVKNVSDNTDDSTSLKRIYFDKILKKEIKKLKQFLEPGEEYLGLARQIINKFLEENFPSN